MVEKKEERVMVAKAKFVKRNEKFQELKKASSFDKGVEWDKKILEKVEKKV